MAVDDNALLVPAVGEYWFHPDVGVEPPSDPDDPGADGYVDLGHTRLEEPFSINSEGGERTVLGTWRNARARTVESPRIETFAFVLQQWTQYNYKLYYGSNAVVDPNGYVYAHKSPTKTEGTLWVRITDAADTVAFHALRVEVFRNDTITLEPQALGGLPVGATVLGRSSDQRLYGLTTKGASPVASVAVTPSSATLSAEDTEQLTAEATHEDSSTSDVTLTAQWGSSDEAIATVDTAGEVTALAAGSATVTAVYQGHSGSCEVTVS